MQQSHYDVTLDESDIDDIEGSSKGVLVDDRGVEPLTSALRTRRATNCANRP